MTRHTYKSTDEKLVLTGMVVNDKVLSRIAASLKSEHAPFRSKWSNQIAKWCLEYHAKYNKAPGKVIESLFSTYANNGHHDDETVATIEKYLGTLSNAHEARSEDLNPDYVVDVASRHFKLTKAHRLQQALQAAVEQDDASAVDEEIGKFKPIDFSSTEMFGVFTDLDRLERAFNEAESDVLIRYPGALGNFFGNQLQRDAFISFLAPDKRGKSYWLLDIAWRASVMERKKVLYYCVGDLSADQMWRRLGVRASFWPMSQGISPDDWPHSLAIPKKLYRDAEDEIQVDFETRIFNEPLSGTQARSAMIRAHMKTAHRQSLFQFECSPSKTRTLAEMEIRIEQRIESGWMPDILVIDYADVLAPEPETQRMEKREQIDYTWAKMRGIGQKYHMLVVTASQSNASAYNEKKILSKSNFSDSKTKNAHVSGTVGINQTEKEKEQGVYRLNWTALREGPALGEKCVYTAGCLGLANPAMKSCW